jgi:hypothetical protein
VYVQAENGVEPREIKLGLDNNRMAHVISGLEAGERVLLNPPLKEAATSGESGRPPEGMAPTTQPVGVQPPRQGGAPMEGALMPGEGMRGERRQDAGEGRQGAGEGRQGRRGQGGGADFQSMTPEQREARRKQFMENMTPEQKQQFEQRMRERGTGGGGGRGADGAERPDRGSGAAGRAPEPQGSRSNE